MKSSSILIQVFPQKLAESSPAAEGDPPLLDEFQSQWDPLGAEELVEEMEVLLIRLDTTLSLLPTDKTSPCSTSCPPLPVSINIRSAQDSALPPDQTEVQRTPYSTTRNAYFGTQTHGPIPIQHSVDDCIPLTHVNDIASEPSGRHNGRDIMNDVVATASTSTFVQLAKLPTLELPEFDGSVDAFPEVWTHSPKSGTQQRQSSACPQIPLPKTLPEGNSVQHYRQLSTYCVKL
ncbi:hypothetical protein Aduo_018632 [Ancylostoma duodenale]